MLKLYSGVNLIEATKSFQLSNRSGSSDQESKLAMSLTDIIKQDQEYLKDKIFVMESRDKKKFHYV